MQFRRIILKVLSHFFFESLAYFVAFRLYMAARDRNGDFLPSADRWRIVVAAMVGAAIGAKLLYLVENPSLLLQRWNDPVFLLGGKTVIGALLGGTIGVEWTKRRMAVTRRTGDVFAVPIAIGIAIGRIGCYRAGLADDTYGLPTSLPWAVDFGDHIGRHPVQLYEIAFLISLAFLLRTIRVPRFVEGTRYRCFLFSYCCWRLLVDFLKPGERVLGLTSLQVSCCLAALWYSGDILRMWNPVPSGLEPETNV